MQSCLIPIFDDTSTAVATAHGQAPRGILDAATSQRRIVIVDDEELNILVVGEYLKSAGYHELAHTTDPFRAIGLIAKERPDLVLLDIHMPQLNGIQVLRQIRAEDSMQHVPVVILTSESSDKLKMDALHAGANDFLQKPVHSGELLARVRNILLAKAHQDQLQNQSERLEALVRQRTAQLEASRREIIHCLARAAEYRDDDTGHHVIRVGRYVRVIGEELGFEARALDDLEQAAKLHDVGKIGIPDDILLKSGKLTDEEFNAMRQHCNYGKHIIQPLTNTDSATMNSHTSLGAEILEASDSPLLEIAKRIALTHHERWDGSGYPLGLMGEDIPLEGRITAVADVFDALSSRRPYKAPFPLDKCFEIMLEGRGTHFDPRVLDAFVARREDIVRIQIEYANEE
jgi:putative two-component system response regulator